MTDTDISVLSYTDGGNFTPPEFTLASYSTNIVWNPRK